LMIQYIYGISLHAAANTNEQFLPSGQIPALSAYLRKFTGDLSPCTIGRLQTG